MKTALTILCVMSAMCAVGAAKKPTVKKTSLSAAELRTFATSVPTAKNAGVLYSVAMATSNNVERKQAYLKAAAACLIASDKNDVYKTRIKGKLLNAAEFEDELKDNCKQCSGVGMKDLRCFACNGSGRCSSCKGTGELVKIGFDSANGTKPCHKCNGDGRCIKCSGNKAIQEKCMMCAGKGKVLSKEVSTRAFRNACNAIADNMEAEAREKAEAEKRERERIAAEERAKAEAEKRERERIEAEERAKAEAVKWYRKAVDQGDAVAQYNLGVCYFKGEGVAQDYAEAVKWFRKAAELGHAEAQRNLAICYVSGRGVEKDIVEAAKWFRKAADQGDAEAQLEVGTWYSAGTFVNKDYSESVKWFRKAADQGHAKAQF